MLRSPRSAPAPSDASRSPDGADVLVRVVLLVLGIRCALWLVGAVVTGDVLGFWSRWDAPHYLRIAEAGYRSEGEEGLFIVFFPLYPALVAAVRLVARDLILSGLVVSAAADVAASWFLYRLVRLDRDHDEAWRVVVLLHAFPTAYFLAAPYSEALFLAFLLGSMYAARRSRWALAGLSGASALATRLAGVALAPALAVEAISRPGRWSDRTKRLAWASLAGLGLVVYLGVNLLVHDDPLTFLQVQRSHWDQRPVPPWRPLADAVEGLMGRPRGADFRIIFGGRLAAFAFAAGLLAAGIRRLRPADQVYGWSALVVVSSASWLISLPRYLLGIYPIFVVAGALTRRRGLFWTLVGAGTVLQVWFFVRYARALWTF